MRPRLVIIATLLVQGILLSITFPISEVWTRVPLLYNDNAYKLYEMQAGHVFAEAGTLVGYDPTFAAGYPGGLLYNWSAKVPWLLAAGFHRSIDDIVLYKVYVFLCGVLGPVWIPIALRRLGANATPMAVGAALAVILWWASWFHWIFTDGMVSYVTCSYLSVLYLVEIIRYVEGEGGGRRLVALGVAGAALFFFHPLFTVGIGIGTLLSILLGWPHVAARRVFLLGSVVPTLSLLPNLPWLMAMREYAQGEFWTKAAPGYFNVVDANILWKEAIGVYRGQVHGSKAYAAILGLTLAANLFVRRRAEGRRIQIFTLTGLVVIGFASLGGAISAFQPLEPNRHSPVGYLFLAIPAVFGFSALRSASRSVGNKALAVGARVSMVAVAVIAAYCLYEVFVEVSNVEHGRYAQRPPQVQPIPERVQCVTQWLESDTTRKGRVLFEMFPGGGQASDVAYYAYRTNREFIAGLMPDMFFAKFVSGRLFGEPIESIGEGRFMTYMRLYNIGWIVAYTLEAKRTLETFPKVAEVRKCEGLTAYRVEQPLSYFLEGRGVVAVSEFNNVLLDEVEGDAIVLKYNYMHGLRSTPQANIEPITPMEGMPPFIRIVEPPRTLRLYLGRDPGR